MNRMAFSHNFMAWIVALALTGCSSSTKSPASLLKNATSSTAKQSEMSVERLDTAGISILRVGSEFHQVKDCVSAERLAKLLYLPIPLPNSHVTLAQLKAENGVEGAVLSCNGQSTVDKTKILHSPERNLYRIPAGGASQRFYAFAGNSSKCRDNASVLRLFGIDPAFLASGKVEDFSESDVALRCGIQPPKFIGTLFEEAMTPAEGSELPTATGSAPQVIEINGTIHVVRNCSMDHLAQTMGVAIPPSENLITLDDEMKGRQGYTIFCTDKTNLTDVIRETKSENIPKEMYSDSINGIYYIPTGRPDEYYYIDIPKNACPLSDATKLTKMFGSKIDGFTVRKGVPVMAAKPIAIDCSTRVDGIELFQSTVFGGTSYDLSTLEFGSDAYYEKIDKTMADLRIFIVESTYRGRTTRLYFQSADGQSFYEPISPVSDEEKSAIATALKAGLDLIASRYLNRTSPALLEIPVVEMDRSFLNSVLFDLCSDCNVRPAQHKILRLDSDFPYPQNLTTDSTLRSIPSASGAVDVDWSVNWPETDSKPNSRFKFLDCPASFYSNLSLAPPASSSFIWMEHWRSYFALEKEGESGKQQVFSCDNIPDRNACVVQIGGTYTSKQLTDKISQEAKACTSTKLILKQTTDIQINADGPVRILMPKVVKHVVWQSLSPRNVNYSYSCVSGCTTARDIRAISIEPPIRIGQDQAIVESVTFKNINFAFAAKSTDSLLTLTGLAAEGVHVRLNQSKISNPFLLKTGVKISGAQFYCFGCTISAKTTSIESIDSRLLITASESGTKDAVITGTGLGLSLVRGTELWAQNANVTADTLASIDSGLGVVLNSKAIFSESRLKLNATTGVPAFRARFLDESPRSGGSGDLQLLGTEVSGIPLGMPDFVILKQFAGSNGRFGSVYIDNRSRFVTPTKVGDKVSDVALDDFEKLLQILHCDDFNNPVKTQYDPYGYFCGE